MNANVIAPCTRKFDVRAIGTRCKSITVVPDTNTTHISRNETIIDFTYGILACSKSHSLRLRYPHMLPGMYLGMKDSGYPRRISIQGRDVPSERINTPQVIVGRTNAPIAMTTVVKSVLINSGDVFS